MKSAAIGEGTLNLCPRNIGLFYLVALHQAHKLGNREIFRRSATSSAHRHPHKHDGTQNHYPEHCRLHI